MNDIESISVWYVIYLFLIYDQCFLPLYFYLNFRSFLWSTYSLYFYDWALVICISLRYAISYLQFASEGNGAASYYNFAGTYLSISRIHSFSNIDCLFHIPLALPTFYIIYFYGGDPFFFAKNWDMYCFLTLTTFPS